MRAPWSWRPSLTRVAFAVVIAVLWPLSMPAQAASSPPVAKQAFAAAVDSALDAQTRDLASGLRCPVCQGLSIQESPSGIAQQMRAIARQQLAEGRSPDDVRKYFVARYGEWILMAPPAHGFSSLVYVTPALLLVGGALWLVAALRRWTTAEPASGNTPIDG